MAALPLGEDWKRGDEQDIYEIRECYCPNCGGGNAVTIMLPTKVPLFREIIVMSLACEVSFVCFFATYTRTHAKNESQTHIFCLVI
jgi:C4-type Zn-finger protein